MIWSFESLTETKNLMAPYKTVAELSKKRAVSTSYEMKNHFPALGWYA